jgi:hypothetical protein
MKLSMRAYRSSDEECVVNLWLNSYCDSRYGRARGANVRRSNAREAFRNEQRCTTMALIDRCGVVLLVDSEDEDVIWAFACSSPGALHFAVAKRDHGMPAGERAKFLRQLVDFERPMVLTHEVPDILECCGPIPANWREDPRAIAPALMGYSFA